MVRYLEITKFPKRIRTRMGIEDDGGNKWIRVNNHGSKVIINEASINILKTSIFDIICIDDLIVQIILTEKGQEIINNITDNLSVGDRKYINICEQTGVINDGG